MVPLPAVLDLCMSFGAWCPPFFGMSVLLFVIATDGLVVSTPILETHIAVIGFGRVVCTPGLHVLSAYLDLPFFTIVEPTRSSGAMIQSSQNTNLAPQVRVLSQSARESGPGRTEYNFLDNMEGEVCGWQHNEPTSPHSGAADSSQEQPQTHRWRAGSLCLVLAPVFVFCYRCWSNRCFCCSGVCVAWEFVLGLDSQISEPVGDALTIVLRIAGTVEVASWQNFWSGLERSLWLGVVVHASQERFATFWNGSERL